MVLFSTYSQKSIDVDLHLRHITHSLFEIMKMWLLGSNYMRVAVLLVENDHNEESYKRKATKKINLNDLLNMKVIRLTEV